MRRRQTLPLLAGLLAGPALVRAAFAWPDQPVKIIVPFTPGTGPDIIARFVAERLTAKLGQPVVVENVAGASGNIGSQQVARAKPDGHTLMSSVNTLVMNPSLYKNLPYDPVTDFVPLGLTAWGSLVLVANPNQKPTTLAELIAAAKAAPKTLTYGSPGVGTPHHLSMALVETSAGIELLHVPYKGTAGAVQDLLGGQIGYMFLPVHVSAQHIRAGKLKAIAVGSPQRLPQLPDVPTLAESGLNGVDVDMWYGFFLPKGTPPEIVARLNREVAAILNAPEAKAAFEAQGLIPATSTSAELGAIVARDRTRWADVVAKRGIAAE
ncbi:MAG: tripartite tricarboxylate transporter substrate binding protein [Reyranella sp.]|uniref:Bug family tripartite tricarboxylate transporter substrate binding protein n=1 Tax=Reyranella sp. TaxID=1929291 RepID=UPI001224856B|nr:tripartite tricarboxylate transporter substrate binding protein [Reyranella sp.]TAJ36848.1 MAG: tripartite tricarboxylate transporter substrate binding protein [Reyranella sp.]